MPDMILTTCPDPTHRVPADVRSDEAYRRWLAERQPCPTCKASR